MPDTASLPSLMTMTADPDEEDIPLLNSGTEQARKQSPFPWFQFSILFAVQTAEYLPLNTIYPFLPDVRTSSPQLRYRNLIVLPVDSTYWDSKRRKGRGILRGIARTSSACPHASERSQKNRHPLFTPPKSPRRFVSLGFPTT